VRNSFLLTFETAPFFCVYPVHTSIHDATHYHCYKIRCMLYYHSITEIKSLENCWTALYRTHACFRDDFGMLYNKTGHVCCYTSSLYKHSTAV